MSRLRLIPAAAVATLVLAGCKTNSKNGFDSVQTTVRDRTGQELAWPVTQAEADRAGAAVTQLLQTNLTLNSAVQIALLNNRSLRATLEEIGISAADVRQAELPPNPRFFGYLPLDHPPLAPDTEFSLSEDFFNLLLLPLKTKIASGQFEETKLRVSNSVLQLVADVKIAFYTVQARQQLLDRLKTILDLSAAGNELSERQYKAGNINDLQLADQQAVLQSTQLEFDRARAQLRLDRDRLNRVLGLWGSNAEWTISEGLPSLPAGELSVNQLDSLALQDRLDLAAAQRHTAALHRALSLRTKTQYLPTQIDIGVESDRQSDHENLVGPSLEVDVPIFDHGQASVARLQAEVRQAQWREEALIADIHSEVRQALDTLGAARDMVEFYQKIYLPQRARISRETLLQYNAMQAGAFALMSAKKMELDAEREYIESWRDYWIARAELERAAGGKLQP